MKTTYLVLDYETFSRCNLKKAGAYEYSVHPSTEILCAAFAIGTLEELKTARVMSWVPNHYNKDFKFLLKALLDPAIKISAHNALFEQLITKNVFGKKYMKSKEELQNIPLERWLCTAALARARGLPGNLEGACSALNLSHQKDLEGHKLMLKLSKPKKPSKKDPSTRHQNKEDLERLLQYCKADIEAEKELLLKLPSYHPLERKTWELDQKMNLRGFAVDRSLVKNALKLIEIETSEMDLEVKKITQGKLNSARQRNALLLFLKKQGLNYISDLRAETLRELLKKNEFPNATCKRLIEIRNAISKSSTAKYSAFEIRSRHDGRARDNTIWYGAHTGRQSGTGLQPQNLFKRVIPQDEVELGIDLIKAKDVHLIRALFDKPMELYASVLRSTIVAEPGSVLEVGDFATIEVRVLFWLCGNERGLKALKDGEDLYLQMAAKIYKCDFEKLKRDYLNGDEEAKKKRQVGKHTVLGAGFGIGINGEKFQATCKMFGVDVSLELAKAAITAYRELHPRVPIFWSNLEKAAVLAIQNPTKKYKLGHLVLQKSGDFLEITLPSGRKISYFKPLIVLKNTPWGQKPTLSYRGVEAVSKKFVRLSTWGGKLTENVVQACAADILMEALLRFDQPGKRFPVLAVHDEIVCETKKDLSVIKDFEKTMSMSPPWAKDLPIKVEAWSSNRYRK